MTHTINQKQWGETVLADYNEGLHKLQRHLWWLHTCKHVTHVCVVPFKSTHFVHTVIASSMWEAAVDGLFRRADMESDGDCLLCSNYTLLLFFSSVLRKRCSSDLCWTKHLFSLRGSSGWVWSKTWACMYCMLLLCCFFMHQSVIVELLMNIGLNF